VGKDKFENEDLIKYGFDEDVWFHVDKMSSAHVYLRCNPGDAWDALPEALLQDLAQLTKKNSIEGCKKQNVTIIYTPWSNLKKTNAMETGQVSFHKDKLVKKIHVATEIREIVNRLNKTKEEKTVDFAAEKLKKEKSVRLTQREVQKKLKQEAAAAEERKKQQYEIKTYSNMFLEENMVTNRQSNLDDDFM
jgi:hypothetical protein